MYTRTHTHTHIYARWCNRTNLIADDHRLRLRVCHFRVGNSGNFSTKLAKRLRAILIGNAFSRTQVAQQHAMSHDEADSRTPCKIRQRVERNSSQSSNPKWKWKRFGYYTKDGRNAVVSIKWRLLCPPVARSSFSSLAQISTDTHAFRKHVCLDFFDKITSFLRDLKRTDHAKNILYTKVTILSKSFIFVKKRKKIQ